MTEADAKQTIWEVWYDVLFRPADAIGYIARHRPVVGAFITFLVSTMLPLLAMQFYWQGLSGSGVVGVLMIIQTVAGVFTWFLGTAVFHLIAEFSGGKGTALGLFSATGFTYLPRLFMVPLWLVLALLPETVRPVCLGIGTLLVLTWTLFLDMKAIQGNYCLPALKAAFVLTLPLLAVLAATVAVIVVAGASSLLYFWQ